MNRIRRRLAAGLVPALLMLGAGSSPSAQVPDPSMFLDPTVFARGTTGDLVMYHHDLVGGQGWTHANLSANRGASYRIVGNPSPTNVLRWNSNGPYVRPDVFARNASGELLDFYWTPTLGWQARNRTNEAGGGRFTGNPVAVVSTPDDSNAAVYHVFGRGRVLDERDWTTWLENRLIHYWSADGTSWHAEDLTETTDAPTIFTDPDVVLTGNYNGVRLDVFARDADNQLVRYWWTPQAGWNQSEWNLTALATGGQPFSGEFDAVFGKENGLQLHVYALKGNGQLLHYYSVDTINWHCENLSGYLGGIMSGRPDVVVSYDNRQLRHDVIARSNAGRLLRYTWTAALGWRAFYVWAPSIVADPIFLRDYRHGAFPFDVFARGTVATGAGDLIHLYQAADPASPMGLENLTTNLQGQRFVAQPSALATVPTLEVFARTSEGHLLRYWYDKPASTWTFRDLTTDLAGPTIAGHPVVLFSLFGPPQ